MHCRPRLFVLVCAAWLVTSAPAHARVPDAERHDALAIAAKKWGSTCTSAPQIRFEPLGSNTLGEARWSGMWDVPPDEREGCRVVLNSRKAWDWDKLCTTVVHEYGHLSGHQHSSEAGSPMDASYQAPYQGCVRARAARRWSG